MNIDELVWRLKTHGESITAKRKVDIPFPEKICLDLKMCSIYIDPEEKFILEMQKLNGDIYD